MHPGRRHVSHQRRRKTRWGLSARTICGLRMMCASITVTLPASQSSAVLEKGFAILGTGGMASWLVALGLGLMMENWLRLQTNALLSARFDLRLKSIPLFPKKNKTKNDDVVLRAFVSWGSGLQSHKWWCCQCCSSSSLSVLCPLRLSPHLIYTRISPSAPYISSTHVTFSHHLLQSPHQVFPLPLSIVSFRRKFLGRSSNKTKSRYRSPPTTKYIKMMSTPLVILSKLSLVPPYHNDLSV